ncbi:hypothetical protein GOZ90_09880 [Agrobacterium vitis]|uniref:Uncharacterized protein n=1 Tax=Agrobacterium vitis TaxID=373 RepID=A0A6L6VAR2_AGRVI|nr:hypothetical protein [Agrobacterium vitis]MUZ72990.1 hypothetical protein [Agrobacterium vitis]
MIDLFTKLWELLAPVKTQLISLSFTLIGAVIFWFFRAKVKIIWGRSNNSIHFVKDNDNKTEIYCEKYFVQNTGRKPATDVRFSMTYKPDDFSLFPSREYEEKTNPQGHYIVKLPFIAPNELVIIDVVYIQKRAASVEAVLCSEAVGKNVAFVTNRRFHPAFSMFALVTFFLGIAFLLQLALSLTLGR